MTGWARRGASPRGAIAAVLMLQVAMAGALVWLDLRTGAGAAAPGLFAPPAQGPSVRPYRPDLRPGGPASPGAPAMRAMPAALDFAHEGTVLRISGQVAPGDADRFVQWLDAHRPEVSRVDLDSSGGSVADAVAIGRTLRAVGYATHVAAGAVCLSACPYMLAGGPVRSVDPGALVGVHQHSYGENTILPAFMAINDIQRAQAGVMDFLTEMGVDLRLLSYALRTPPDEINLLDEAVMRELRLVTAEPRTAPDAAMAAPAAASPRP